MAEMRKIVFIIDKLIYAGAQKHIVNLAVSLVHSGYKPYIICLMSADESLKEFSCMQGVEVLVLGLKKIYDLRAVFTFFRFVRWMAKNKIDIVQTYLFSSHVFGSPAAYAAGVRIIISCRRATVFWNRLRYRVCRFIVNPLSKITIANSEWVKSYVMVRERLPAYKILVIPNGVDTDKYKPLTSEEKNSLKLKLGLTKAITVLTVANLLAVKGVGHFIETAKELLKLSGDVDFIIAGEGPQEMVLKKQARGYTQIVFKGRVAEPLLYFQAADFFLLLSDSEGMSNALLEAMSCGCVSLVTNRGGNLDVIQDRKNGFLVNPGLYNENSRLLLELINDCALRSTVSLQSRVTVVNRFTLRNMVNSYKNIYDSFSGSQDNPGCSYAL